MAFLMQAVKTNTILKKKSDAAGILWEPDGKFDNWSQGSLSWEPHRLFLGPGSLMFVDWFFIAHLELVRLNLC